MYAKTTTVPVEKSRGEIERLLSLHKCSQFISGTDYDAGLARVQFKAYGRFVRFVVQLPNKKNFSYGRAGALKYAQAERQRWRALLLVIKAKFESVESGISSFEKEFLAEIVMPGDQTIGDLIVPQIAEAYERGVLPSRMITDGEPR
jgi:hypothetical protein